MQQQVRCPQCGRQVTVGRATRATMQAPRVVDLSIRCAGCGTRVDASGVGDDDAMANLRQRMNDPDRTRKLQLAEQRRQRYGIRKR